MSGQTQETMTMTDASSWLAQNAGGESFPSVSFPTIGNLIVGKIVGVPRVVPTTNDKGEREDKLVIDLVAQEGTTAPSGPLHALVPIVTGETYALWVKRGALAGAIQAAITEAGATGLQEGGTLAVQYTGDGERKPGKNPPKLYAAQYKAPVASVSLSGLV